MKTPLLLALDLRTPIIRADGQLLHSLSPWSVRDEEEVDFFFFFSWKQYNQFPEIQEGKLKSWSTYHSHLPDQYKLIKSDDSGAGWAVGIKGLSGGDAN